MKTVIGFPACTAEGFQQDPVPSPSISILLINILDSAEAYSPRVLGQDDEGSFERPSKRSKGIVTLLKV